MHNKASPFTIRCAGFLFNKKMMNMNLNELRDKAYQCAVEHGWHDEDHFLCLVISELMEAVEADRKGKRAQVGMFKEWLGNSIPLTEETRQRRFKEDFEAYIKGSVEEELVDACIRLLDLAGLRGYDLFSFCKDRNIHIFWHIDQKMKYNELRPYKHGNKVY